MIQFEPSTVLDWSSVSGICVGLLGPWYMYESTGVRDVYNGTSL